MREDRSVVFLHIYQDLSTKAGRIYRVSLEGNVAVIAEFSLVNRRDWYADGLNLYNGPQGGLIFCDNLTVNEIRDGAVSPITSPSDTYTTSPVTAANSTASTCLAKENYLDNV